jgi:Putative peptidoglycan binding domain
MGDRFALANVRTKLLVTLAIAVGGAVLVGALTLGRRPAPPAPSLAASVTTATVTRQTLLDQFQTNGTIGYSGAYTVLNQYSPPPSAATVASAQHALDAAKQNLSDTEAQINFTTQQDAGTVANDQSLLTTDQQKLAADATCATSKPDPTCAQLQQAVNSDQAKLAQDQTRQQSDQLTNTQKLHQAQQQVTTAQDTYDKTVQPGGGSGGGGAGGGGGGATGVYTALPAVGQTVTRGQTVYSVNGQPIPLLYGGTPIARQLTTGVSGDDVKELEDNLIALGYGSGLTDDGSFTSADTAAVKRWQAALGVTRSGVVNPGDVVVLPGALRVSTVKVQVGASASTGAEIIDGTSPDHVVSVALDARQQTLVAVGAAVSVSLPNGSSVNGTITDVGTVATTTGQGAQQQTTIPVTITLADNSVAGKLDGATVTVNITRTSHKNVLAVPVTALIALTDGGYAIETADRSHRRIPVQTGLFSNGQVEISGPGVVEGLTVVAPSLT